MAEKEYIERSKVKDAIFEYICGHTMSKFPSKELLIASKRGAEGAYNELDYVPAADVVEVRHGEWIKEPPYVSVGGEYKKALICSICNSFFVSDGEKPWELHNYCPQCGARMDGERKEQK